MSICICRVFTTPSVTRTAESRRLISHYHIRTWIGGNEYPWIGSATVELHCAEEETDWPFSFFNRDFAMFAQINTRRRRSVNHAPAACCRFSPAAMCGVAGPRRDCSLDSCQVGSRFQRTNERTNTNLQCSLRCAVFRPRPSIRVRPSTSASADSKSERGDAARIAVRRVSVCRRTD